MANPQPSFQAESFSPLAGVGRALIITLWLTIALKVVAMGVTIYSGAMQYDGSMNPKMWHYIFLMSGVGLLRSIVSIVFTVFLCKWTYRAYKNLYWFGAQGLEAKPKLVVWSWFIPFANLVYPYRYTCDIWRASDPRASTNDWKQNKIPNEVRWWWATWLAGFIVPTIISMIAVVALAEHKGSQVQAQTASAMLSHVLFIISSVLSIRIIQNITERQEHKNHALAQSADL